VRRTRLEGIDALAELERWQWKFEPLNEEEIRCRCPVHEDTKPSVSFNVRKNVWQCHASHCRAKGDIVTFLCHVAATAGSSVERGTMLVDLADRYDIEGIKEIDPRIVEKMHSHVLEAGPLLAALRERGVTDDMLRVGRIGFHDSRITIPIFDRAGRVVNIRRYLPGAPSHQKMKNTRGYGEPIRIYRPEDVDKDVVWVCGGEIKALVVGEMLKDRGIGVVSATAGEGNWDPAWSRQFKDKTVYVCMDVDAAGRAAARKVAGLLDTAAKSVRIIFLPLDRERYPKGDVNDYVGKEGATADDLVALMEKAEEFVPETEDAGPKGTRLVELSDAPDPDNVGWKLDFVAVVSAEDTTPFLVPKDVAVACTRDQPGCPHCPVLQQEQDAITGFVHMTVPETTVHLLDMVNAGKAAQKDAVRSSLHVPECKTVEFSVRTHHSVRDVRLVPRLEISDTSRNSIVQPAFCVNKRPEMNVPMLFSGVVYPHPRNQQAVLVVNEAEETTDSLTSFQPDDDQLAELEVFRPEEWTAESIESRLDAVYSDIEANVTRIFGRRELHVVIDLAFHSVLMFRFDDKRVNGWLNALIVGDSSQGKSETSLRLMEHYELGERVDCKNATIAGLLGGLQQLGSRWFVSWGMFPTHDKRILFLEELKGLPVETIAKMTDMRSSGIAEIPKIEKRRTLARTRGVYISNARSNRSMRTYSFGIEAIAELIGGLEDVRRFDVALLVSADEIPPEIVNTYSTMRPRVEHVATSELCKRLILWAWTRNLDEVHFEPDATEFVLDRATYMCSRFSESMPLVDRGTMRLKIARLAAAMAARTFSSSEDMSAVIVRRCHVEYVSSFVDKIYSSATFGYLDFSRAQDHASRLANPEVIRKHLLHLRHPADTIRGLLYRDEISLQDMMDWCQLDRDNAQGVMSFLVRKHAITRISRFSYVKTGEFIDLLKRMESEELPEQAEVDDTERF